VTFNFDRSFERALFLFVKRVFRLPDEEAALIAGKIPVLHIHGDLGWPDWLANNSGEWSRPYGASVGSIEVKVETKDVIECAKRIRLVTEEIPEHDPTIAAARRRITAANRIVFMGFAYEHRNLQRLGIAELIGNEYSELQRRGIAEPEKTHPPERRRLHGTSYRMTQGNIMRVTTTLPLIHLESQKAHIYVQGLSVLHGVAS
jgi:hypothetical protein